MITIWLNDSEQGQRLLPSPLELEDTTADTVREILLDAVKDSGFCRCECCGQWWPEDSVGRDGLVTTCRRCSEEG